MKDTTSIEKKAVRRLEEYLEDSVILSPFIMSGDKTPVWDGHLYLYRNTEKKNENLVGRIPVQVKGTEVEELSDHVSFAVAVTDLRAYLKEPTVYVVCQEKKGTKEYRLFFYCFLPVTVRRLMQGKNNTYTINVHMEQVPEHVQAFDTEMEMFLKNKEKQGSFAEMPIMSLEDVCGEISGKVVAELPSIQQHDILAQIDYLTSHPLSLYLRGTDRFIPDIPIDAGEDTIVLQMEVGWKTIVDGVVYCDRCNYELHNGVMVVNVGDMFTMTTSVRHRDVDHTKIEWCLETNSLRQMVRTLDLWLAIAHGHHLAIGPIECDLVPYEWSETQSLRESMKPFKELVETLDIMHVTKDVDLDKLDMRRLGDVAALVKSILHGEVAKSKLKESTHCILKIGNLKVLLCCIVEDGMVRMLDFFDPNLVMYETLPDGSQQKVDALEYARRENLCSVIDNVPEG